MAVHRHLLLLLAASPYARAQPSTPSADNYNGFGSASFNSTTAVVLIVLVSAICFLAFLSIYFRRCSFHRHTASDAVRIFAEGGRRSPRRGLDPALLDAFPTMVYSEVKGLRTDDKVALECAVCLSEFGDEETLRMLPGCSHAFHPSCIDTWLASHVTCPVCRSILTEVHLVEEHDDAVVEEEEVVAIDIDTGGDPEQEEVERVVVPAARFPRSHTTGHSVEQPRPRDGWDRYTLRLPEHVKKEIVAAGKLQRASSCAGFPDGGVGEGSSRGGRSMRMGGRSDRWAPAFVVRALSARVVPTWRREEREGEGERKTGEAAVGVAGGGDEMSDSGEGDSKSSTMPPERV